MFTSLSKIKKARKGTPDAFEESVAQAIYDLQTHVESLKATLREVHITSAKQVDNSVLIFVPVPQLSTFQKLVKEKNLVDELEKKFTGKQVIILAERRILPKETRTGSKQKQLRPRRCSEREKIKKKKRKKKTRRRRNGEANLKRRI